MSSVRILRRRLHPARSFAACPRPDGRQLPAAPVRAVTTPATVSPGRSTARPLQLSAAGRAETAAHRPVALPKLELPPIVVPRSSRRRFGLARRPCSPRSHSRSPRSRQARGPGSFAPGASADARDGRSARDRARAHRRRAAGAAGPVVSYTVTAARWATTGGTAAPSRLSCPCGCDRLDVPARQDLSHELRRCRLHRDRRHVDGRVPSAVQDRHGRSRGHDRRRRPGAGRGRLVQPSRGRHVQRQRHDLGNRELHHCHLLGPDSGSATVTDLSRQRGQRQLHGLLRTALRHDAADGDRDALACAGRERLVLAPRHRLVRGCGRRSASARVRRLFRIPARTAPRQRSRAAVSMPPATAPRHR